MIKIENYEVLGWEHAVRGMRNPMNSWAKSEGNYLHVLCKNCIRIDKYRGYRIVTIAILKFKKKEEE